ncbi:hypothetical protein [Thermoactinospora rubra]|uniref:hypothetical protein n=1 Tax=Thermoactinospora rubra TaxID=1088767 RepID=UPI000A107858|nr:hypothetical protein [Thermoactinospora rubra]
MAKFDGMDPKLVRELLAEVRHAATRMRQIEGRVAQLTGAAGVAVRTTHRPSQVADACDEMVRDVTARLALLEKREDGRATTPPASRETPPAETPADTSAETSGKGTPKDEAPREQAPKDGAPKDGIPKEEAPKGDREAEGTPDEGGRAVPRVVEVDGVRMLQVPLDSPVAQQVSDLVARDPESVDLDVRVEDGEVVSVEVTPPADEEVARTLRDSREVPPADMPSAEDPRGGPQDAEPDGRPGTVTATAGNVVVPDGGVVVSVEVTPPSDAWVAEILKNSRDVEPMDMPSVEVPKGEWGSGEWAPKDVKPDGPPGSVEPGAPGGTA